MNKIEEIIDTIYSLKSHNVLIPKVDLGRDDSFYILIIHHYSNYGRFGRFPTSTRRVFKSKKKATEAYNTVLMLFKLLEVK